MNVVLREQARLKSNTVRRVRERGTVGRWLMMMVGGDQGSASPTKEYEDCQKTAARQA